METPFLLVINGISGSGKTTLAEALHQRFESSLLFLDNYYHPSDPALLAQTNMDRPEAIGHELLEAHLRRLKAGETVKTPLYGFNQCQVIGYEDTYPHPLVILEGQYCSAFPEIQALTDAAVLLKVPYADCLRRRQARDLETLRRPAEVTQRRFLSQVVPGFEGCLDTLRHAADLVLTPTPDFVPQPTRGEDLAWGEQGWEAVLALLPDTAKKLRAEPTAPGVHRIA